MVDNDTLIRNDLRDLEVAKERLLDTVRAVFYDEVGRADLYSMKLKVGRAIVTRPAALERFEIELDRAVAIFRLVKPDGTKGATIRRVRRADWRDTVSLPTEGAAQ